VLGRIKIAPKTRDLLFYYYARADQETGQTTVSAQRASQDLGIRKDHVDEYDRKLVRDGFIAITKSESGGRIIQMRAPWRPRSERNGHPAQHAEKKAASQVLGKTGLEPKLAPQNLGNPLDGSPKFGQSPQVLEEPPQNLGEPPQNLGAHIGTTSSGYQLMEPGGGDVGADARPSPLSTAELDALAEVVTAVTGVRPTGWRIDGDIRAQAIELHKQDFNPASALQTARRTGKVYKLNFCARDLASDRAQLARSGSTVGANGAATQSGREPPLAPNPRTGKWGKALTLLEAIIGTDNVAAWVEPLNFAGVVDSKVLLSAPAPVFQDWVEQNYAHQLSDALREAGLGDGTFAFETGGVS
jgi:hypothetical protein